MSMRNLVVFTFGPMLAAQCPPSEGTFAGAPVALSTREATGATHDPAQIHRKKIGFLTTPPSAPTFPSINFDLSTALRSCAVGTPPDVDAVSIGLDWILADNSTGKVAIPRDRWATLLFSVTPGTMGKEGGAIRTETGRPDGAAADVFSFWLPGSTIPNELVARTQRAVDSREVDLGLRSTNNDIDGLDLFIPMYGLEPAVLAMLPIEPRIFFSVSAATLGRAPLTWFGGGKASAATVLSVRWIVGTKTWSCPSPFLTYAQLGLDVEEDLDALALDLENQRVLFSTKTSRRNPILFTYYGTDAVAAAVPYVDVDNVPISEKIGLIGDDDVDAICGIDPSIRSKGSAPNPAFFVFAAPRPTTILPYKPDLSASSFRDYASPTISLQTFVVGWPPTGPGNGFAALFLTLPDSFNPAVLLAAPPRNLLSPFCGDPRGASLTIPGNLSLHGAALWLRWLVVDQPPMTFAEAHPLQVRL
jgi:hypothetical protein